MFAVVVVVVVTLGVVEVVVELEFIAVDDGPLEVVVLPWAFVAEKSSSELSMAVFDESMMVLVVD